MRPEILALIMIFLLIFGLWIVGAFFHALEVRGFTGCAIDSCPKSIQEWYYNNGGVPYYSKFEQDSKEYWHSYCTLLPDKC